MAWPWVRIPPVLLALNVSTNHLQEFKKMRSSTVIKNAFILISATTSVAVAVLSFQQGMEHVTNTLLAISLASLCLSVIISNQEKTDSTEISELQDTIKETETDQRFQELRSNFDRDIKEIHHRISMSETESRQRSNTSEKDIYYAINEVRYDLETYKKYNDIFISDNKIKMVARDIGVRASSSVDPDISC